MSDVSVVLPLPVKAVNSFEAVFSDGSKKIISCKESNICKGRIRCVAEFSKIKEKLDNITGINVEGIPAIAGYTFDGRCVIRLF